MTDAEQQRLKRITKAILEEWEKEEFIEFGPLEYVLAMRLAIVAARAADA